MTGFKKEHEDNQILFIFEKYGNILQDVGREGLEMSYRWQEARNRCEINEGGKLCCLTWKMAELKEERTNV